MKIKTKIIALTNVLFFWLACLIEAQCPQTCEEITYNGQLDNNIYWGNDAGGTGNLEMGIGHSALQGNSGDYNMAVGDYSLSSGNSGYDNAGIGAFTLLSNGSGIDNTAVGFFVLDYNTTGTENTAIGTGAMPGSTASFNTATGAWSMGGFGSHTGSNNTAAGYEALYSISSGGNNTATGYEVLYSNTSGGSNTASGYEALYFNTTGSSNTATGRGALYKNTASNNTATGYQALNKNTSGGGNTAHGYQALLSNTSGYSNTATGSQSLYHSTGTSNTGTGQATLYNNTSGGNNTATGLNALFSNTIGSGNIAIGGSAGYYLTTGSNNIDIGNVGVAAESETVRIGTSGTQTNTYISGIYGVTVAGGIGVIVDSNGHLGTSTSSARFKENIQAMDKASEAILSLQPVSFHYKKDVDPRGIPQFGLVAEQVEKVNPDLVARDEEGKPYSVRYEAVNAMLLNEFLKEHRRVESLEKAMAEQKNENEEMRALLKEQAAQIRKVSEQPAISRSAPRVVVNDE